MSIPSWDNLIAAGEELLKWGIGVAIYLIITISVGLIILAAISIYNKPVTKFIK